MKKSLATAVLMVLLVPVLMLSSCKKKDETLANLPPEQAARVERFQKSVEKTKTEVVAKVNGEPITSFAVLREMNAITQIYMKPGQPRTPELARQISNAAFSRLVFKQLAVQEARKRGMTVKPEIIDEELKKIRTDAGSEDAYRNYLDANGFTEKELKKSLEEQYLLEMILSHEIYAKISVTDAVLQARYKMDKTKLKTNDAVHRQMSFEQAKGLLEQRIKAEQAEKIRLEWEKELRENARIEIIENSNIK